MAAQTVDALQRLLGAEPGEVAFLEHTPDAVVEIVLQAARAKVDAEDAAVVAAIASAGAALPAPLGRIVRALLG